MVTWPGFSGGSVSSGYYRGDVPLVVGLGDSITDMAIFADYTSGTYIMDTAEGEITWAHKKWPFFDYTNWATLADPYSRGYFGADLGVSGDRAQYIVSRLQPVGQQVPDAVIYSPGVNDINAGRTSEQILTDDATTIDTLVGLGIPVIVGTVRPVGTSGAQAWASDDPKRSVLAAVNLGRAALVSARDPAMCVLWDVYAAYNDGSGFPKPGYLADGLHPRQAGAHAAGASLVPVLQSLFPAASTPAYPTYAVAGNFYPNSRLTGAGGVVGASCTGTIADNWSARFVGATSSSAACSLVANADTGGQSQVFTITPSGSNSVERIFFELTASTFDVSALAGKWVRSYIEIEFNAWDGWRNVRAGPSIMLSGLSLNGGENDVLPASVAGRHIFLSPVLKLPASPSAMQPYIDIYLNPSIAVGAGILKIHKMWLGEVPNPGIQRNMVA